MNRKLKNEELGRHTPESYRITGKIPIMILLDNVRSAYNAGSVFRTADAFLAEGIILCGISASPPHRELRKTALGADETVKWSKFSKTEDAIIQLKSLNYKIIAIEQTERSVLLNRFVPETGNKYALIFGNEVNGVSQRAVDMADAVIEIPQSGTKHSLNIAVSAGIVLWEFYNRLLPAE